MKKKIVDWHFRKKNQRKRDDNKRNFYIKPNKRKFHF